MKFPEELKEGISQLPSKEKEKLIFRLLKQSFQDHAPHQETARRLFHRI